MLPSLELIPGAINEMLATVSDTGKLTLADRYGLMAAIFDETLAEDERRSINRLLRAVVKGKVEIA
jgi:hypothetical protein